MQDDDKLTKEGPRGSAVTNYCVPIVDRCNECCEKAKNFLGKVTPFVVVQDNLVMPSINAWTNKGLPFGTMVFVRSRFFFSNPFLTAMSFAFVPFLLDICRLGRFSECVLFPLPNPSTMLFNVLTISPQRQRDGQVPLQKTTVSVTVIMSMCTQGNKHRACVS